MRRAARRLFQPAHVATSVRASERSVFRGCMASIDIICVCIDCICKGTAQHGRDGGEHPAAHRRHASAGVAPHRTRQRRAHSAEAGERESNGQHEGPHGSRDDRGRGGEWTPHDRWFRRRIYRRQHRRLAVPCLRGERLQAAHRDLGRVLPGKTRSHGHPWRPPAHRAQRQRTHDGEADTRHG